ncbi:hypothetical protein [Glutamicibacter protophormiae]|uniref:hypothetical protein n=1 Tax=Glutamicibacter protophormiae TaxID=37930 RepID=UPI0019584779|nr:hypothetical protein [Glutamicibacter protophormiae]QRQ78682.1 hypothetical protein JQN66_17660 [Glutamicibacter protophormiae]
MLNILHHAELLRAFKPMSSNVSYGIICMVAGAALLLTLSILGQSRSSSDSSSSERVRGAVMLPRWLGIPALFLIAAGTSFFTVNMLS